LRRRGCLITFGVLALLLIICCGLVFFVAIPRVRDAIETGIGEGLGTEIASQLPAGELPPGTYPISLAELERQLTANVDAQNVQGISLAAVGDRLELGVETDQDQTLVYSGRPVAENGRLVMQDMSVNNDALEFVLPADQLGEAIERGINDYFAARGLQVGGIELEGDEIVVEATQ
jgi:hypothetical protein